MYSFSQIASILQAQPAGNSTASVKYLSTDSRRVHFPADTLFFTIITPQRNGHAYVSDAYTQGVRQFVISEELDINQFPGAGFMRVQDTLSALQTLAAWHRRQFDIPIVGITGSNGKTIVKEWLTQLLQPDANVVRSPRSYNSQTGVPLSIWQIDQQHEAGIFEAGISQPGEMQKLAAIIQPTIGIFTNIGAAHDAGFTGRNQKLQEKLKLFAGAKTLIYNANDKQVRDAVQPLQLQHFSWGFAANCTVQILELNRHLHHTAFVCRYGGENISFQINFTDNASLENVMHSFCACLLLGIPTDRIVAQMQQLQPLQMRLEWKKAINNCYLINDSYSNDLSSLLISLDYLEQQSGSKKRMVILSDIFESGISPAGLYEQVATLLEEKGIDRFVGIGPAIAAHKAAFTNRLKEIFFYPGTEAYLQEIESLPFSNEAILLKGARAFGFEKIARQLEEQSHQTVLEINLTAMANNLKQYRSQLQPGTRIMVMVKSFGYGSGGAEIARLLQFNQVDYLAVAYADEAVPLRQAGVHTPVMVMNPDPAAFEIMEAANLEPEIYSFEIGEAFLRYCKTQGITGYPVHIKIDTGMHRLGFLGSEADAVGKWLQQQNILKVKSVFTHLVGSDDARLEAFTRHQAADFDSVCQVLQQYLGYSFLRHTANTAAIARYPHLQMDMVRLGIGLYGIDTAGKLLLEPVSTLQTSVAQVKKVPAGDAVGYNRKGMVTKDSVIATVRIGYADGYRRELSNGKGYMLVHGQKAPVIGNVSMDMTMLDVTGISNVIIGDKVEVFGKNISVQEVATQCGTIPYEIMTGISQRVKRVYYSE